MNFPRHKPTMDDSDDSETLPILSTPPVAWFLKIILFKYSNTTYIVLGGKDFIKECCRQIE